MTNYKVAGKFFQLGLKVLSLAAMLSSLMLAQTSAGENCSDVTALRVGAENNFANGVEVDITSNSSLPLMDAKTCGISLQLGGIREFSCIWEFGHKAEAAAQRYDFLLNRMTHCLKDDATVELDQPVNHPDFYALSILETKKAILSTSIKDKSALDRSYVFLRAKINKVQE